MHQAAGAGVGAGSAGVGAGGGEGGGNGEGLGDSEGVGDEVGLDDVEIGLDEVVLGAANDGVEVAVEIPVATLPPGDEQAMSPRTSPAIMVQSARFFMNPPI